MVALKLRVKFIAKAYFFMIGLFVLTSFGLFFMFFPFLIYFLKCYLNIFGVSIQKYTKNSYNSISKKQFN